MAAANSPPQKGAPKGEPAPLHVAIVMDGNGRWAKRRGLPRTFGHPQGVEAIRRTVKAGETVGLTGALPLSVVIGRASAVDVRVRGKPFDLTPLARSGGVARFEVKP